MGEVIEFYGSLDEPIAAASQPVTRDLKRILALLREGCPAKSQISFDFDGKLHAHIDVRKIEEAAAVEAVLLTLGEGLFSAVTRRATPHHPFFHRISAEVNA